MTHFVFFGAQRSSSRRRVRPRREKPELLITGTGRSGTGYISRALTRAGLLCGHESWFRPGPPRRGELPADSSWCAVPDLDHFDGPVFLQVRHPLHTLRSLVGGELFVQPGHARPTYAEPFWRFITEHLRTPLTGNPAVDAGAFIVEWTERARRRADRIWRVEDQIDEALLADLAASIGREIDHARARRALDDVSADHNRHPRASDLTWDALPAATESLLRDLAADLGYGDEGTSNATLCLVMIVRNEAHIIEEALESLAPYITDYVILDTGSSDGTPDVIRRKCATLGLQGTIFSEPFIDFGRSRSRALELAREASGSEYLWMMDADDLVVGEPRFGRLTHDAYHVRFGPDFEYQRLQIFRRVMPFYYRGVVHEAPACDRPFTQGNAGGQYYLQSRRLGARSRDPRKYHRDAELLAAEVRRAPTDARSQFYLAQSLFDAGQFERALAAYRRRIELGGFPGEVFYSRFRLAQCLERLERGWDEVREAYLECFDHHPDRAEPLAYLARCEREQERIGLAYALASRAATVPHPPPEALFVDRSAYEFRARDELAIAAHLAGRELEAFAVASELLSRAELPDGDRRRIERNRDFAAPAMRRAMSRRPDAVIDRLTRRATSSDAEITLSITTCRRFPLFCRTVDSFLSACTDVEEIGRFVVIDDGSSSADVARMRERYPFFEWIDKPPGTRGHARSMNQLLASMTSRYWLHLEDDFEFFEPRSYVADAIDVLEDDADLGQVLFNRGYAESLGDRDIDSGPARRTARGLRYRIHRYGQPTVGRRHAAYWPHFSLRPSMMVRDAIARLGPPTGPFDPDAEHFELDLAERYTTRGLRSAFLDTICCEHIGRRTGERGNDAQPNAYQLANAAQFGEKTRPVRIAATITSCRRPQLLASMLESLARHCVDLDRVATWTCIDDGTDDTAIDELAERFPHVRFIRKPASERGHAAGINRILRSDLGRFILHLEDDWEFTRDFHLGPLIDVLVGGHAQQLCLTPQPNSQPVEGLDSSILRRFYDPEHPDKPAHFRDYDRVRPSVAGTPGGFWWPGFSLNPCLMDAAFFRDVVGEVDERVGNDLFEYDYALRAAEAGAVVCCTNLGVVHRGAISAYTLSGQPRTWDPQD